jgi:hypothetical protein
MASGDIVLQTNEGFAPALILQDDTGTDGTDRYLAINIGNAQSKDASLPGDPSYTGAAFILYYLGLGAGGLLVRVAGNGTDPLPALFDSAKTYDIAIIEH